MEEIILFINSDSCESYLKFDEICKEETVKRGLLLQPGLVDHLIYNLKNIKVSLRSEL